MLRIFFGNLFQILQRKVHQRPRRLRNRTFACSRAEEKTAAGAFEIIGEEYIEVLGMIADGKDMRMEVRTMIRR